jgi:hypothetical protein
VFAAEHEAASGLDRERIEPIRIMISSPALRGEYLKTLNDASNSGPAWRYQLFSEYLV